MEYYFFKRGQISTEYLIIIAFVMFVALTTLGLAVYYGAEIQDTIKFSQIERFAKKVIASAESVGYGGEPSRVTIEGYIPDGVNSIEIADKEIYFNVSTRSGRAKISYTSNVHLNGTVSSTSGVKRLQIAAVGDSVWITQV